MKKRLFIVAGVVLLTANSFGQSSIRITEPALGSNSNTMFGVGVPSIESGSFNTFIGNSAGIANTSGFNNTYLGFAGYRNTSGNNNTFLGYNAGSQNTVGFYNTSIGSGSGAYNNGNGNVFLGVSTGHYTMGSANVLIGNHAGYQYHGDGNVIIGNGAVGGYPGTYLTGNDNIFLGNNSYALNSNLTNAIAIGKNSKAEVSNTMILGGIGNDGVSVGIGTTNPSARLDVLSTFQVSSAIDPLRSYRITTGSRQEIYANNDLLTYSGQNNAVILNTTSGSGAGAFFVANKDVNNPLFTVNGATGKTGIGTTYFPSTVGSADLSTYKLFVNGGILANEIRVRTDWADYVFANDYTLKPLLEVEAFIQKNKHLPNVPSAKQVEEGGISVGEIVKIQQEKIEELTLYIIKQEKRMNDLEDKLNKK